MPRKKAPESVPYAVYHDLLDKYHALKVMGAVDVQPLAPLVPKPPDAALQAAVAKANGNPRLTQHYMGYIAEQRRLDPTISDMDLAMQIEIGMPDDPAMTGVGD